MLPYLGGISVEPINKIDAPGVVAGRGLLSLTGNLISKRWPPSTCDRMRDVPAVAMNLKVWNSLPAEVRVAMLEVNEEIRYWYLGQYESDERYQEIIKEKGIEIVKVDQEERDYLNSKLEPVLQSWVEKMEAKGVPAKKVVDELKRVVKEY